jgi:undecaprenyl-diphosphatase
MKDRLAAVWPKYFVPARLRRAGLLVLAITTLLFFIWLSHAVAAGETAPFDAQIRSFIHNHSIPATTWFMRSATHLGAAPVLSTLTVAAIAVFLYWKWHRAAVLLLTAMLGIPLFNENLKVHYHRLRPEAFFGVALPTSYSFPSGHSLSAFCFYGMTAALVSARVRDRRARMAIWISGALLILVVGVSRVYLGVHFPSDVIGGYAAALVWISMLLVFDQNEDRDGGAHREVAQSHGDY